MASYIDCIEELRRKAFDESLFFNVRHPEEPTVYDLTNRLLGMDLSPEMDTILRGFLAFVEELQDLFQRELDNKVRRQEVGDALVSMAEGPEKQELRLTLNRLEYEQHRLELEKAAMRRECRNLRRNPPF